MANPSVEDITENVVTKVATNVLTGFISKHWKDERDLFYYSTYRITGEAAPTLAAMKLEMTRMFQEDSEIETISATAGIDVYIIAALEDGVADTGKLVVSV